MHFLLEDHGYVEGHLIASNPGYGEYRNGKRSLSIATDVLDYSHEDLRNVCDTSYADAEPISRLCRALYVKYDARLLYRHCVSTPTKRNSAMLHVCVVYACSCMQEPQLTAEVDDELSLKSIGIDILGVGKHSP